jgi:hypothetical protein
MIDDSQFCDVSHDINNTMLSNDVDEISHTQFGDPDEVDPPEIIKFSLAPLHGGSLIIHSL